MAKALAIVLGLVLIAVGIRGMMTGSSHVMRFGVSPSHNLIHVLSGAVALLAALGGERPAMIFCLVFGVVYGLVAVLGFFQIRFVVQLLNLNMPDNFLHLGISAVCLVAGALSKGK